MSSNRENSIEYWLPIKGYEGIYEISSFGKVRNNRGQILKNSKFHTGYLYVKLCNKRIQKKHRIHRLVLLSFIGNNEKETNHNEKVKEIRMSNMSGYKLAKRFNVSQTCIHRIIKRKTWVHI